MATIFQGLGFNVHGYDYGRSLMVLEDTLVEAERGLTQKRERTLAEAAEYEAKGERIGEWADDGRKIWDQSDAYNFDLELIDEGLANIRKAFVIALYHSWERMVGRWAEVGAKADHAELRRGVEKKGVAPHVRLDAVRDLNNALKHNSRKYGADLLNSWPELTPEGFALPDGYEGGNGWVDWFSVITIDDKQMREIISALRASGPEAFPRTAEPVVQETGQA